MAEPQLWADNAPQEDAVVFRDAIAISLERTLTQARALQQRYLVLPLAMADAVNDIFPADPVPEWSTGFCYTPGRVIPDDGACAVLCLLNKGHQGPCGGSEHLAHVDRSPAALAPSGMGPYLSWADATPTVSETLGWR